MKILLLDDDPLIHETLRNLLRGRFQVRSALNFEQAMRALDAEEIDGALIDVHVPGHGNGVDFLEMFKRRYPDRPAIVQSGARETATVVRCMKLGADDFIEKPFEMASLELRLGRAFQVTRKTQVLQRALDKTNDAHQIVGESDELARAKRLVEQAGSMRILFLGETGVGKTPFAWYSNQLVAKEEGQARPFEQINCAGLTREYFQDQLFGHRKGAFTGATSDKRGLAELAKGGDLFLDEIGEMPLEIQSLFLTFLDTAEYYRLGDDQKRTADVRILCATNRNLKEMVREGKFRKDLYSRISQVIVEIPALRERARDVEVLFRHFVRKFSGFDKPCEPEVIKLLRAHRWDEGNVRELRDAVEYLCILGRDSDCLRPEHLAERVRLDCCGDVQSVDLGSSDLQSLIRLAEGGIEKSLSAVEKAVLAHYFKECRGSVDEIGERLKMSRPTLYRRLRHYGIS